jgi:hypothetical protein
MAFSHFTRDEPAKTGNLHDVTNNWGIQFDETSS